MEETEYCKQIVCRKTRKVLWSELGAELLGEIIGRLCVVADRVRFRAVCKSWRDAKPIINTASTSTSTLSWFVSVGSTVEKPKIRALECRLFDPSYSIHVPVSVHTISFDKLRIPVVHYWDGIRTFCKQGWLFISIAEMTAGSSTYGIRFILFSPLTRKLKQLPSLTASIHFEQTFSSDPESADCVFLLLDTWSSVDFFTVTTCRKGDTQWTVRKFNESPVDFLFSRPTYTRGLFYIISPYNGQVISYNVIEGKIKYESSDIDRDFFIGTHRGKKVFTRNGELMYNYQCNNGTKRFDWSNKLWIPVSSLTDPPAASDKVTRVEDMIQFIGSECQLCSSECSSLAEHLMFKPQKYVFDSGRIKQDRFNSYFWLEPPLLH